MRFFYIFSYNVKDTLLSGYFFNSSISSSNFLPIVSYRNKVAAGPKIESAPIDIYGLIFKISLNYITYGAVNDPTTPFLN